MRTFGYFRYVLRVLDFATPSGYTGLYVRTPRLFETLQQARRDGSHHKTITRLARGGRFGARPVADFTRIRSMPVNSSKNGERITTRSDHTAH
ncbi:hypothetical protein ACFLWY_03800 [Chloroflexota bacterium]